MLTLGAVLRACVSIVPPATFICTALSAVVLPSTLRGNAKGQNACASGIRIATTAKPDKIGTIVNDYRGTGLSRWWAGALVHRETTSPAACFARRTRTCHRAACAIGGGRSRTGNSITAITFRASWDQPTQQLEESRGCFIPVFGAS